MTFLAFGALAVAGTALALLWRRTQQRDDARLGLALAEEAQASAWKHATAARRDAQRTRDAARAFFGRAQ